MLRMSHWSIKYKSIISMLKKISFNQFRKERLAKLRTSFSKLIKRKSHQFNKRKCLMKLISIQFSTSLLRGRLIICSWRSFFQVKIKKYRCTFQIRTNLSSFSKRWVYWKKGFRSKTATWEIEWRLSSFLKTINQSVLKPKVLKN